MKFNSAFFKNRDLIVFYLLLSLIFFVFVALEVLNGNLDFQFYSDSKTWEYIAINASNQEDLTTVSHNRLGPVTILLLFGPQNYWAMFVFNVILFLVSLYLISDKTYINVRKMFIFVMISPITFTSLFSSNKEIFALLCTCLIIFNHNRQNKVLIIITLVLSYMARWQFTLFYVLYLLMFSKYNYIKNRRYSIIIMLLCMTIGLFIYRNTLLYEVFSLLEDKILANSEGDGTFLKLVEIQDRFGYIVVFLPKTLLILIANIKRYEKFFDFSDAYNNVILFLQTVLHIYVILLVYKHKLYKLKFDFFYIAIMYFAVFGMTPIYNPRYFYPAIIFICYELCRKKIVERSKV